MRFYQNAVEMHGEVQRDLFEMGVRVKGASMQDKVGEFETIEVRAYAYTLLESSPQSLREMVTKAMGDESAAVLDYIALEHMDRVSPHLRNPGAAWAARPKLWQQFLHDGRFSYTYNERFRVQLPRIIEELKARPATRQAIVTMWDHHQDLAHLGGSARVPCSMYYQFILREGKLDCIYTMRSCDFLTHFPVDVWLGCSLMQYVAQALETQPGHFIHFIGSLHAYATDLKAKGIF